MEILRFGLTQSTVTAISTNSIRSPVAVGMSSSDLEMRSIVPACVQVPIQWHWRGFEIGFGVAFRCAVGHGCGFGIQGTRGVGVRAGAGIGNSTCKRLSQPP